MGGGKERENVGGGSHGALLRGYDKKSFVIATLTSFLGCIIGSKEVNALSLPDLRLPSRAGEVVLDPI